MMSTSLILFLRMYCNMCCLNSSCEIDVKILSSLINLSFNGFNAAYLLFFALLVLLFFVIYIFLLFSSNIVNEVFGLFISNSVGVI